jgi:phosphoribosylformylglycinamidine cyclo-ligase
VLLALRQRTPSLSIDVVSKATYKAAGVDLELYEESMSRLPRLMQRTFSPRVIPLDGGFAGLFQLENPARLFARRYKNPVLVSGTDGVGTKLKVASLCGRHNTVGIDLVAMCVNDVICCGAEPLFFLDYVAMGKDDPNTAACRRIVRCSEAKRPSCPISIGPAITTWPGFAWASWSDET